MREKVSDEINQRVYILSLKSKIKYHKLQIKNAKTECQRFHSNVKDADFKIEKALSLIHQYTGFDGEHHKLWLIDEIVQTLTSKKGYKSFVEKFEEGEDGAHTFFWDKGIPP